MFEKKCQTHKVRSDIFTIYLNGRLHNDKIVYDYFSNEPNQILKKGNSLFSAGPDTVFNTKDDIELKPLN